MHSCYFNGNDSRLLQLYEKDQARSSRKNTLKIIRPSKEIGRMSLRYRSLAVWNYLPDKLKSTENREHFKSMLKRRASYLNSISFAKETSFNHNNDKDFIYFQESYA